MCVYMSPCTKCKRNLEWERTPCTAATKRSPPPLPAVKWWMELALMGRLTIHADN